MTALLDHDAPESWALLAAKLRERDHDPAYADAPVMDAYGRISLVHIAGDLDKTPRQILECLRNIDKRWAKLGEILRDDNKSASKQHCLDFCEKCKNLRPDFAKLLARMEARLCQGVVCADADRVIRQPSDLARLIWYADHGFLVASCHGDYDLENPNQRLLLRVKTDFAIAESEAISRRQKDKAQAMRDQGRIAGGPRSFGFPGVDRITREPVSTEQLVAEREAITSGAQAFLDGTSPTAIAEGWNVKGLRTATGRPFTAAKVREVLLRPRNAGLVRHGRNVIGKATDVEAILSEDVWNHVRAAFAGRSSGRPATGIHVGSGNLVCQHGAPLHSRPGNGHYADGTPRRQYHAKCCSVGIDQRGADARIRKLTIARLASRRHAAQMERRSELVDKLNAQVEAKKATVKEVGRRLGRGAIDLDEHDTIVDPLKASIEKLKAEVKELEALGLPGNDDRRAPASEVQIAEEYDLADSREKRALVRKAFPLGLQVRPSTGQRRFDPSRIGGLEVR